MCFLMDQFPIEESDSTVWHPLCMQIDMQYLTHWTSPKLSPLRINYLQALQH